jgi:hypothetical protein
VRVFVFEFCYFGVGEFLVFFELGGGLFGFDVLFLEGCDFLFLFGGGFEEVSQFLAVYSFLEFSEGDFLLPEYFLEFHHFLLHFLVLVFEVVVGGLDGGALLFDFIDDFEMLAFVDFILLDPLDFLVETLGFLQFTLSHQIEFLGYGCDFLHLSPHFLLQEPNGFLEFELPDIGL